MTNFNQRYYLVWREIRMGWGKLPAGRQEIVKDEFHKNVDRYEMAVRQSATMNDIYGSGTHWIETEDGEKVDARNT